MHPAPPGEEYPQGGWAPVSGYGHSQQQQPPPPPPQQQQQQPVPNQVLPSSEKSDDKKEGEFIKMCFC